MEDVVVVVADMEKERFLPPSASCDLDEVVVISDVDKECLLYPSTTTSSGMEENEGLDSVSVERARKIREHQGNHETEVSCGGEADLHKHFRRCQKNPDHSKFIPVHDFKKEHLPPCYHDNVIVDWIRAEADLTCRLLSKHTSVSRPQFDPMNPGKLYPFYNDGGESLWRTGTGWVKYVNKYTEKDNKDCGCKECSGPRTDTNIREKIWGEVTIVTACHVIYNSEEARLTTCYFSYDTSTTDLRYCPKLTGLKVKYSDIQGDMCMMTCVTHDMEVTDKLVKLCDRRLELFEKVRSKYWLDKWKLSDPGVSSVSYPTRRGHVVVISHPHGLSKQITVGEWTQRHTQGGAKNYSLESYYVNSSYRYNAATCPGSSGAPVIRLLEKGRVGWWWLLYSHPHSGGDAGNDNYSGRMEEFVSFRPTSSDKLPSWWVFWIVLCAVYSVSSVSLAVMVVLKAGSLYYVLFPVMIIVLCFFCIPWFRQVRGSACFMMIYYSLLFLTYLIILHFFREPLFNYWFANEVIGGAFCGLSSVLSFFIIRLAPPSAYNIQSSLRRRTRVTETPSTTAHNK